MLTNRMMDIVLIDYGESELSVSVVMHYSERAAYY